MLVSLARGKSSIHKWVEPEMLTLINFLFRIFIIKAI